MLFTDGYNTVATWGTESELPCGTTQVVTLTQEGAAVDLIEVSDEFVFFSLSVIIPFGCVCNLLSLATFLTPRMRKQSSCWYLATLAVADTVVLLTELVRNWLPARRIGLDWFNEHLSACVIVTYVSMTSRTLSSWTIVMFTVERTVCVKHPLRGIHKVANTSTAKKVLAAGFLVALLPASFVLFLSDVRHVGCKMECTSVEGKTDLYNNLMLVWILFSTFMPVAMVCALNAVTIHHLYKLKQKRGDLFSQRNYQYAINKNKITVMLLTVSTCFVILATPYLILWICVNRLKAQDPLEYHSIQSALSIIRVFYILNFAINLTLYSLTGSKFRRELVMMVTCVKGDPYGGDSSSFRRRSTRTGSNGDVALQAQRRRSTHGTVRDVFTLSPINEE